MRVRVFAATAAALLAVPFGAVAAQASEAPTEVTIVHGIPGVDVDVFVDEALVLDDFLFGEITVADLPPGEYLVQVKAATASDAEDPAAEPAVPGLDGTVTIGTEPVTLVAQLTAAGDFGFGVFDDDFSEPVEGSGRVTVRHSAAAPEVDILVDTASVGLLENGEQLSADLPAATYNVEVQAGGATVEVLSPGDLPLEAGTGVIAYAVGSLEDETLQLIVDTFSLVDDEPTPEPSTSTTTPVVPTAVPAGDGTSTWAGPLAVPALIALTLGGVLALAVGFAVRGSAARR